IATESKDPTRQGTKRYDDGSIGRLSSVAISRFGARGRTILRLLTLSHLLDPATILASHVRTERAFNDFARECGCSVRCFCISALSDTMKGEPVRAADLKRSTAARPTD